MSESQNVRKIKVNEINFNQNDRTVKENEIKVKANDMTGPQNVITIKQNEMTVLQNDLMASKIACRQALPPTIKQRFMSRFTVHESTDQRLVSLKCRTRYAQTSTFFPLKMGSVRLARSEQDSFPKFSSIMNRCPTVQRPTGYENELPSSRVT
jgi:hypothetical protein